MVSQTLNSSISGPSSPIRFKASRFLLFSRLRQPVFTRVKHSFKYDIRKRNNSQNCWYHYNVTTFFQNFINGRASYVRNLLFIESVIATTCSQYQDGTFSFLDLQFCHQFLGIHRFEFLLQPYIVHVNSFTCLTAFTGL